jgi:hypothetical protein
MSVQLNLTRHAGDTANEVLQFFTNRALTTAMPLTGRTFAGHVETDDDVDVITFTGLVPAGAGDNELELDPATGAWADLELGGRYRWALWETTNGVTETIFVGSVAVVDR